MYLYVYILHLLKRYRFNVVIWSLNRIILYLSIPNDIFSSRFSTHSFLSNLFIFFELYAFIILTSIL